MLRMCVPVHIMKAFYIFYGINYNELSWQFLSARKSIWRRHEYMYNVHIMNWVRRSFRIYRKNVSLRHIADRKGWGLSREIRFLGTPRKLCNTRKACATKCIGPKKAGTLSYGKVVPTSLWPLGPLASRQWKFMYVVN